MEAQRSPGGGNILLPRKPPYSNALTLPAPNRCLVVCTGSGAWTRGRSPHFFSSCKVVLPFGDDPAAYDWRIAAGEDVLIMQSGEHEPVGVIARLGGLLLAADARLVVYCPEPGKGRITRIQAARRAIA